MKLCSASCRLLAAIPLALLCSLALAGAAAAGEGAGAADLSAAPAQSSLFASCPSVNQSLAPSLAGGEELSLASGPARDPGAKSWTNQPQGVPGEACFCAGQCPADGGCVCFACSSGCTATNCLICCVQGCLANCGEL